MTDLDSTPPRFVALFDLDGTLTWRDTLLPFLLMYLRRHPSRWVGLWPLPCALWRYLARGRDRGLLKSRVIRMVMGGAGRADVDACADAFVDSLGRRHLLRPTALAVLEAHRTAGDHLVLLSASPDLYVPRIGSALGFELTLCTEIEWQGDRLVGFVENTESTRHGEITLSRLAAHAVSRYARDRLRQQHFGLGPHAPSRPSPAGERQHRGPQRGRERGNTHRHVGLKARR